MARMAVISGINVVNAILADPGFTLPGFVLVQSDVAGPGWIYSGGTFTPPAPTPPQPSPETAAEGLDGLIRRRIAEREAEGDTVGALALRVELLEQKGQ